MTPRTRGLRRISWERLVPFAIALVVILMVGSSAVAGGGLVHVSSSPQLPTTYRARWAVIIGVDTYSDKSVSRLTFAGDDAKAFNDLLEKEFSFKSDHIHYLGSEEATREGIRKTFTEWLPSRGLSEDDAVVVFFAGHGFMDGLTGYLAPTDMRSDQAAATSVEVGWIKQQMSVDRLHARHMLLILDSCYSGTLFQSTGLSGAAARADVAQQGAAAAAAARTGDNLAWYFLERAFMGISAGRYTPVSDGTSASGHSAFTAALLAVMTERADSRRPDQAFTFRELAVQVEGRVRSALGSQQIPNWGAIEGDGDFIFVPDPAHRRLTPTQQAIATRLEARADLALSQDPGLALAWTLKALQFRGELRPTHFFDARAATASGVAWELEHGNVEHSIPAVAAFLPHVLPGRELLAVGSGKRLRIIDLMTGVETSLPAGSEAFQEVLAVAFLPDGSGIAAVDGAVLRIWRLSRDGAVVDAPIAVDAPIVLQEPAGATPHMFLTLSVASSGHRVAVGTDDGSILVTDEPWTKLRALAPPREPSRVKKLQFSPASDNIVISFDDVLRVHVFDVASKARGPVRDLNAREFTLGPDGSLYYICLAKQGCGDGKSGGPLGMIARRPPPYHAIDLRIAADASPALIEFVPLDGAGSTTDDAATANDSGDVFLGRGLKRIERWAPQGGGVGPFSVESVTTHQAGTIRTLAAVQEWILSAGDVGVVNAYNILDATTRELLGTAAPVNKVLASPDGRWIASVDSAETVLVWSSRAGRTKRIRNGSRAVFDVAGQDTILTAQDSAPLVQRKWGSASPELELQETPATAGCLLAGAVVWRDELGIHGPRGTLEGSSTSEAVACADGAIFGGPALGDSAALVLWPADGGPRQELSRRRGSLVSIETSLDRRAVAASWSDGFVEVWSGAPWHRTMDPFSTGAWPTPARLAVAVAGPESVYVGDPAGTVTRYTPTRHDVYLKFIGLRSVTALAVDAGERLLAAGTSVGSVHLAWLAGCESRVMQAPFKGLGCEVSVVCAAEMSNVARLRFSADGRMLVAGSSSRLFSWVLPPVERGEFEQWLKDRAPWRIGDEETPERITSIPFARMRQAGIW